MNVTALAGRQTGGKGSRRLKMTMKEARRLIAEMSHDTMLSAAGLGNKVICQLKRAYLDTNRKEMPRQEQVDALAEMSHDTMLDHASATGLGNMVICQLKCDYLNTNGTEIPRQEQVDALAEMSHDEIKVVASASSSAHCSAMRLARRSVMQWSDGMKDALVVIVNGFLALQKVLPSAKTDVFWAKVASKMCDWVSANIGDTQYGWGIFSHSTMWNICRLSRSSSRMPKVEALLTRDGVTVKVSSNDHLLLIVKETFPDLSFKEDEEWVTPSRADKERWSQVLDAWIEDGGTVTQKQKSNGDFTPLYGKFGKLKSLRKESNKKHKEEIEAAGPLNPSQPKRAPRERNATADTIDK
jgi:hypothetical protein